MTGGVPGPWASAISGWNLDLVLFFLRKACFLPKILSGDLEI
jgi:hypothetical protein